MVAFQRRRLPWAMLIKIKMCLIFPKSLHIFKQTNIKIKQNKKYINVNINTIKRSM